MAAEAPIVVTGGTGWLGSRLVQALQGELPAMARFAAEGAEIRCLVPRGEVAPGDEPVRAVPGDLRDRASLQRLLEGAEGGTLYHCAGCIHPRLFTRDFRRINARGTRDLLELAAARGLRRAVVVSSNSPIGVGRSRDEVFDERSPYRPYLGYGRSKMEMEQAVAAIRGLETVVVRPPWFYGPGQPARQTAFFSMIRAGRMPVVGDGENRRSLAYVDDLCQGLALCASVPDVAGQTYWIADRRPYTLNEIVDTIERLLGDEFGLPVAHRRVHLPAWVGATARAADAALQAVGLYAQKLHVLGELDTTIACSVEKARRELGYEPTVDLEEGMRRSIRWCLDHGIRI